MAVVYMNKSVKFDFVSALLLITQISMYLYAIVVVLSPKKSDDIRERWLALAQDR